MMGLAELADQQWAPRNRLLLDLVHKQPLLIAFNLFLACLLLGAVGDVVAKFKLLGWAGVMIVTHGACLGVWWYLRRATTKMSSLSIGRLLILASLLSGLGWGFAGLLLVAPGTTWQLMVASFASATASAIMVLPSHPAAYCAFILPALLPYVAWLGFGADPIAQMIGPLLFLWLGGISFIGHEVNRSRGRAISLSLENAELVADLEGQRRGLQEAQEALRLSEQRFRDFTMTLSASEWLWETDAEHRFTWFSPNVTDLAGAPPPYGKTRRQMMTPGVDPELIEAHWQVLEAHEPFRDVEYVRRDPDGDTWLSASGVPIFDEAGRFQGYRGVGRNISDRKLVEAELAHLAHHDSLTTLANRRTLQRRLEQALSLATRQQRLGALLLFDLDNFKEINDAHGHLIGDQLLREVASRLRPAIRESDTFARFGGDEFAVVASDVAGSVGAADLAQRLVKLMAKPFRVGDGVVHVGASIGVALFPEGTNDPDQLITRADRALYWAKHESRGQVRFYDLNLDSEMQRHKQPRYEVRRDARAR